MNTPLYTEAGKEAVMQIYNKLMAMTEDIEVQANTSVHQWISDDLDYIDVFYLGKEPDGDRQEEYYSEGGEMMTDAQAIDFLNVRYNNTLTAIGR